MRLTLLGCGTSVGVPAIGCECATCASPNPKNKRLRASAWLQADNGASLLIDTSPDLRQQALRHRIPKVDGVLYTHAHADHTLGLDDLRIYNFRQKQAIPVYGSARTLTDLKKTFWYVVEREDYPGSRPGIEFHERPPEPFDAGGLRVTPISLLQFNLPIWGFRFGGLCYITDCSRVPDESWALLENIDTLIVNALRPDPHPTHFSVPQALEFIARLKPRRAVLTHMNHELEFEALRAQLPAGVEPAYDGIELDVAE